jgi:PBS lyase HEAT-like repeat
MSIFTRFFGTKEERERTLEAKRQAQEQARNIKLAPLMKELRQESYKLSTDLVRRYVSGQLASGVVADRSAIRAIGNAFQRFGRSAVRPLCDLVEKECYSDDRLIYAAEEAISVLARIGDREAIPAIVQGASLVGSMRETARKALMTLGGQAAVDLLEKQGRS